MATQEIQTMTTGQMRLLQIMREIMNSIGNNLPFGHGMRSYANFETRRGIYEREKKFPRAFMYPVTVNDAVDRAGQLSSTYECTLDFLDVCKLDAPAEELERILSTMFVLSGEFLIKLINHPDVIEVSDIVREPNYHVFDANLCGWLVKLSVRINEAPIC